MPSAALPNTVPSGYRTSSGSLRTAALKMASAARPATRALRLEGTVAMLGQMAASMVAGGWGTVYGTLLVTSPLLTALPDCAAVYGAAARGALCPSRTGSGRFGHCH